MKVLDVCSGTGMFSLGLDWAGGFETVAFCEHNEKARELLAKRWPKVPQYNDVRELTAEQLKNDGITEVDIVCGGIPCQPYSRAKSSRQGRADDRDLAGAFVDVVCEFEPAFSICENVQGFVDIGLVPFLDDLEARGYFSETLSIPSCAVGLPSMERHVWVISSPNKERCERVAKRAIQIITDMQGQFQGSDTRIPDRWSLPEARVCRVGERDAGRVHRLEQIGNSLPPIVPKIIGQAIMETEA